VHERIYPDEEDHLWVVGNLPDDIVRTIFKKIYMRELFTDANPFQYVQVLDTLQYYDNFNWLTSDFIDPNTQNCFDGDRVEKMICWSKEMTEKYPYLMKVSQGNVIDDRIDLVIDAEIWKFNK
jgi:hypothetical protein